MSAVAWRWVWASDEARRGYASGAERFAKQRRLQVLEGRLATAEARLQEGRVAICRGGRHLAGTRHHLAEAALSDATWRRRWEASRSFITADGETDKAWGNETIRWNPERGWVEIKLPAPLARLSNVRHGRWRLSACRLPR